MYLVKLAKGSCERYLILNCPVAFTKVRLCSSVPGLTHSDWIDLCDLNQTMVPGLVRKQALLFSREDPVLVLIFMSVLQS